jgi:hypothetical protein
MTYLSFSNLHGQRHHLHFIVFANTLILLQKNTFSPIFPLFFLRSHATRKVQV